MADLCEGVSVNGTVRLTGIAKTSILRLLVDMGRVCINHEDATLRDLHCADVEADEIWGFNYCKRRALPSAKTPAESAGDVWTWYAVDRKSKAIISWIMGDRETTHAYAFMVDLAARLVNAPELSTDGLGLYADAVEHAFRSLGVNYSQVHKIYANTPSAPGREDGATCIGCTKKAILGKPNLRRTGTSRVERSNLTLRMSQRRWTRKTNAHSKKFTNMQAAFALHSAFYNWARPHASLEGKTPAMVLGVANRVWTVADLVGLLEADEAATVGTEANMRGAYRKRTRN